VKPDAAANNAPQTTAAPATPWRAPAAAAPAPTCLAEKEHCVCGGDCCGGLICAYAAPTAVYNTFDLTVNGGAMVGADANLNAPACLAHDDADLHRGVVEYGCTARGVAATHRRRGELALASNPVAIASLKAGELVGDGVAAARAKPAKVAAIDAHPGDDGWDAPETQAAINAAAGAGPAPLEAKATADADAGGAAAAAAEPALQTADGAPAATTAITAVADATAVDANDAAPAATVTAPAKPEDQLKELGEAVPDAAAPTGAPAPDPSKDSYSPLEDGTRQVAAAGVDGIAAVDPRMSGSGNFDASFYGDDARGASAAAMVGNTDVGDDSRRRRLLRAGSAGGGRRLLRPAAV
jgi:hypothetical protein